MAILRRDRQQVAGERGAGTASWSRLPLVAAVAVVGLLAGGGWTVWSTSARATPVVAAAGQATSDRIQVAVIGDSYTQGTAQGGTGARRWPSVVSQELTPDFPVTIRTQAISGSGYVGTAGIPTFGELVPLVVKPSTRLVVLVGSRNDAGQRGLDKAVDSTIAAVRAIAPQAQVLVVGPPWTDGKPPVPIVVARDSVENAARRAGVAFVDPLDEGWFGGPEKGLIGDDDVHPTDAGHAYMAARMLPHLRAALTSLRSA